MKRSREARFARPNRKACSQANHFHVTSLYGLEGKFLPADTVCENKNLGLSEKIIMSSPECA